MKQNDKKTFDGGEWSPHCRQPEHADRRRSWACDDARPVAGERGAADAEEEGFTELAARFRRVAAIEKSHEERYRKLLQNVEMQQVFEKSEQVMWECRICGHLVVGKKAPKVCPVCKYSQSYFEVRKENY